MLYGLFLRERSGRVGRGGKLCVKLRTFRPQAADQASGSQNSDSEADSASSPVSSAAHTHAYGAWYAYREAACTEAGEERRDCACGEYDTRVIPALGHNYGEWRATKEASCTEDGERERECSRCRETETEKIEKLGHDYVDGICTRCQEVNPDKIYTEGSVRADAVYGIGGEDGWTLDKAAGVYTSRTEEAAILMFKNWEFEGGVIEWDMNVPTDTYKHNTTCGLLFASPNQRVISSEETDSYYVFGRAFTGEFVGYCKRNGEFFWEDGAKLSPPLITCTAASLIGSAWNGITSTVFSPSPLTAIRCLFSRRRRARENI